MSTDSADSCHMSGGVHTHSVSRPGGFEVTGFHQWKIRENYHKSALLSSSSMIETDIMTENWSVYHKVINIS